VAPEEVLPDLIIRNKSRDIHISRPVLNQIGAQETTLLKKSVLFNYHGTVKTYSRVSCHCFKHDSAFRQWVIWFVDWKYFEYFILFIIFLNSVALTMFDYTDRESKTTRNQLLDVINATFTAVYTLEAFLKIVTYGFVRHQRAYIRDVWNCIDFVVVIAG
jgi:hypothetical protein